MGAVMKTLKNAIPARLFYPVLLILVCMATLIVPTSQAFAAGELTASGSVTFNAYTGHDNLTQTIRVTNKSGAVIDGGNWWIDTCDNATVLSAIESGEFYASRYNDQIANNSAGTISLRMEQIYSTVSDQLPPGTYSCNIKLGALNNNGAIYKTGNIPVTIRVYNPSGATVTFGTYSYTTHSMTGPVNALNFGTVAAGTAEADITKFIPAIRNDSATLDPILGDYPRTTVMLINIEGDDFGAFRWNWYNGFGNWVRQDIGKDAMYYYFEVTADATYLPAGTYNATLVIEMSPYTITWNGKKVTDGKIRIPLSLTVTGNNPNIPAKVQNLTGEAGNGYVNLSWNAVESNNYGYIIWRKTGSEPWEEYKYVYDAAITNYCDSDVTNGTAYTYAVSCDALNAPKSDPITITPSTTTTARPPQPYISSGSENGTDGKTVKLEWRLSDDSTGEGIVKHFIIYCDGSPLMIYSQNMVITDWNGNGSWLAEVPIPTANEKHEYSVVAVGTSGQQSFPSDPNSNSALMSLSRQVTFEAADLTYLNPDGKGAGVVFSVDFMGSFYGGDYRVTRDGSPVTLTDCDVNGYSLKIDRTALANKTYTYTITPIDWDGNDCGKAVTFKIYTVLNYYTVAPNANYTAQTDGVTVEFSNYSGQSTVSRPATFKVYRNNTVVHTKAISADQVGSQFTYTDKPTADGTYVYRVDVVDNATGIATSSKTFTYIKQSRTDNLVTPPNAPTNVTAAAGDGRIKVSWNAPTSGSAPTKYVVYGAYKESDTSYGEYQEYEEVEGSLTSCVIRWSNDDGPYKFIVCALNAAGKSPNSNESEPVMATSSAYWYTVAPVKPTITSFNIDGSDPNMESMTFAWTPNQDINDIESIHYELKDSNGTRVDYGDTSYFLEDVTFGIDIGEGTYTLELTAINKVGSSPVATASFVYTPINMAQTTIAPIPAQGYSGTQVRPIPTVTYNGMTLVKDVDYTVSYGTNTTIGTNAGTLTITGTGGLRTGTKTVTFDIRGSIASANFSSITNITYTGDAVNAPIVKDAAGATLAAGTNYTYSYLDVSGVALSSAPVDAGSYSIKFTGIGNYAGTTTKAFKILPKQIPGTLTLDKTSAPYSASGTVPSASVSGLTKDADFDVIYKNASGATVPRPVNAGTYTVVARGIGNYTGELTASFTITPTSIDDATDKTIDLTAASVEYNGSSQGAQPLVTVNNVLLTAGTDYDVVYKDASGTTLTGAPVNPGTYTVVITGKGNYTGGNLSTTFTITPQALTASNVTVSNGEKTYNGQTQKPTIVVKNAKGATLTENTDYTVFYTPAGVSDQVTPKDVIAGGYDVHVKAQGGYTSSDIVISKGLIIAPATITTSNITGIAQRYPYEGSPVTPEPVIKTNGVTLAKGVDYTLSYQLNDAITEDTRPASVQIDLLGTNFLFDGGVKSKQITFLIKQPIAEGGSGLSLNTTALTYGGALPQVTTTDGTPLVKGTDYTVSYTDAQGKAVATPTNAGTYTLVVTGAGNYAGTWTKTFTIKPIALKSAVFSYTTTTYSGGLRVPGMTVYGANGRILVNGVDYTYSPSGRTNVGVCSMTFVGRGNYTGTIYKSFTVKPSKTAYRSLRGYRSKFTVKWKRSSDNHCKYQIAYRKKGTKRWRSTYVKGTSFAKTITRLRRSYYYVRIRARNVVNSKVYYGKWSTTKRVRVK